LQRPTQRRPTSFWIRVEAEKWTQKQLRQAVKKLGSDFVVRDDDLAEEPVRPPAY
jgi:hypothetical protein